MDETKAYQGFLATPHISKHPHFMGMSCFFLPKPKKLNLSLTGLSPSLILGKRAEVFFTHSINLLENYKLIASNLQLIVNKKTLGEFDFFIEELTTKQVLHIELVYKIYLYDPSFKIEEQRWIGPNRKDTLLKKVNHLKSHQLPLVLTQESKLLLKSHGIHANNLKQKVCFKAQLFIPEDKSIKPDFSSINQACIVGYYISYTKFTKEVYGEFQFYSPKKSIWFTPPLAEHKTWLNFEQINLQIEKFILAKKSVLLWVKKSKHCYTRLFIVWW